MASPPALPIPVSFVNGKYFLFDVSAAAYLRREHRICGVLLGSLPQSPSQNVFLGLPVELMPEEVHLLVSKGVACVSDSVKAHEQAIQPPHSERLLHYRTALEEEGSQAAHMQVAKREQKRTEALRKKRPQGGSGLAHDADGRAATADEGSLFQALTASTPGPVPPVEELATFGVTPATSNLLLPSPPATPNFPVDVPPSYPLYAHLHSQAYFISPGLRFGCQYMVYPGDPLRFHSHFLAQGVEWDEEIDLMDVVGGGRLGTGVKKGYLLGGRSPGSKGRVRTFSIEWAGM